MRWFRNLALGAAAVTLAACGGSATSAGSEGTPPAAWAEFRHLPGVVDLAGPRGDGSFVVAAAGRLLIMGRDGTLTPFARGEGGYQTAMGTEPYLALASRYPGRPDHCPFGDNTIFALEPVTRPGVIMISPQGQARRFASLPPGGFLSGIAFDGAATCSSPPRAARRPSMSGARRHAPYGTSPPGPLSLTPKGTSSSRRHDRARSAAWTASTRPSSGTLPSMRSPLT